MRRVEGPGIRQSSVSRSPDFTRGIPQVADPVLGRLRPGVCKCRDAPWCLPPVLRVRTAELLLGRIPHAAGHTVERGVRLLVNDPPSLSQPPRPLEVAPLHSCKAPELSVEVSR